MSSRKRPARSASRGRPKRTRPSSSTSTSSAVPPEVATGTSASLDVEALTASITAVVTSTVQAAMKAPSQQQTNAPRSANPSSTVAPISVEEALSKQMAILTSPQAGTKETSSSDVSSQFTSSDKLIFSSLALELGGSVTDKIKAKICANEYVDFGLLLTVTPSPDRYSLSINTATPSLGTQLTLEPYRPPKKITNINQWLSTFNTFVAIYVVHFPLDAPKLMKNCEIVRDISAKLGDWVFYDEQFRLLRQTVPNKYPWDAVHWELWLRVTFRGRQTASNGDKAQGYRPRSKLPLFPKGTCWAFQAGRFCGEGCKFEPKCYKCGAKHPATRCHAEVQKSTPLPTIAQSSTADNARRSR